MYGVQSIARRRTITRSLLSDEMHLPLSSRRLDIFIQSDVGDTNSHFAKSVGSPICEESSPS
jgi:hypothetical protein